jgi:hypothetical protein
MELSLFQKINLDLENSCEVEIREKQERQSRVVETYEELCLGRGQDFLRFQNR